MTAPSDPTVPRALARAPFALLTWVLTALVPADVLSDRCRALVLRALLDFGRAVRAVLDARAVPAERATFEGLECRTREAVTALGEDHRALTEEALPPPTVALDGRTVQRVIVAFAHEMDERGIEGAELLPATFDSALCDKLATRASAIEPTSEAPRAPPKARRRR